MKNKILFFVYFCCETLSVKCSHTSFWITHFINTHPPYQRYVFFNDPIIIFYVYYSCTQIRYEISGLEKSLKKGKTRYQYLEMRFICHP